jgi:polyisoprenoid-binding protein YceI
MAGAVPRHVLLALVLAASPCRAEGEMPTPVTAPLPAGAYRLDPAHASLLFRADHLGMSRYTARFTRFDAELTLDPANPGAARLTATVDPLSLETDNRDPTYDFDAILQGPEWLNAARFPQITFRSTAVELTGPDTARLTGELGLHGVTAPVALDVTFNGGYASFSLDPSGSRIGFSARGTLLRSAFGIAFGIPPAGSTIGVGDEVEIIIEAEFTRPAS